MCEKSIPEYFLSMRNIPMCFRHSSSSCHRMILEPFTALQFSPLSHSTCYRPLQRLVLRIHRTHGLSWAHPQTLALTQLTSKGRGDLPVICHITLSQPVRSRELGLLCLETFFNPPRTHRGIDRLVQCLLSNSSRYPLLVKLCDPVGRNLRTTRQKFPSSASHRYLSLKGFEDCVSYMTHTMFLVAVLYGFFFIFF